MSQFLDKAKNFVADKVAHVKKPEADIIDVDLKNVSRQAVEYNAEISIDNPYSHSIPICQVSYKLRSAGREIISGTMADPGSLKESEKTMLNVPLMVPYNVIVSLAKDIGADWDIDYECEIGLTIDLPILGEFTIPLSKKGAIRLPSLTDVF